MRKASAALSLVPQYDVTVYLVLDDYGSIGRVYRETDEGEADLEKIISNIQSGQYKKVARVIAFNTAEGWARDVTEDVALEVRERAKREDRLGESAREFVEHQTGRSLEWLA
jgi:hypothetical protein